MTLAIFQHRGTLRKNSKNLLRFQIIEAVKLLETSKTYGDARNNNPNCSAASLKYISIIVTVTVK